MPTTGTTDTLTNIETACLNVAKLLHTEPLAVFDTKCLSNDLFNVLVILPRRGSHKPDCKRLDFPFCLALPAFCTIIKPSRKVIPAFRSTKWTLREDHVNQFDNFFGLIKGCRPKALLGNSTTHHIEPLTSQQCVSLQSEERIQIDKYREAIYIVVCPKRYYLHSTRVQLKWDSKAGPILTVVLKKKEIGLALVCHRKEERSSKMHGHLSPLRARSMGILIGGVAASLATAIGVSLPVWTKVILAVPLLVDGFTQLLGKRRSNNVLRLATGFLLARVRVPKLV